MRSRWILIGQSFPKTIRTIEDKIIPSRGGRNPCASPRGFAAGFGRLAVNWLRGLDRLEQHVPNRAPPVTPDILLQLVLLVDFTNPVEVTYLSAFLCTRLLHFYLKYKQKCMILLILYKIYIYKARPQWGNAETIDATLSRLDI